MSYPQHKKSMVIKGVGAVSPAGWSTQQMVEQTLSVDPLGYEKWAREGCDHSYKIRRVPKPLERQAFARHPRLRRASAISRFVAAAGLQALGEQRAAAVAAGELRLGIVVVFSTGCVTYTRRFFEEMLDDPALASPILFPETVFNAPASHLAAILGSKGISYTLLGDGAEYLSGLKIAEGWLATHQCDGCLVIGGEELDWLISEAVHLFSRDLVLAEGAGALYLERPEGEGADAIKLAQITPTRIYTQDCERDLAPSKMRADLELDQTVEEGALLIDGLQGVNKTDRAEAAAWESWRGSQLSPGIVLGTALGASVSWQCVHAVSLLQQQYQQCDHALVSAVGLNQQCMAAHFSS
ncbi:MAG: hypothetical protein L3J39_13805 [Verrucomicrobiales bacterium]|nr:hypothetical protein [Verrucomicrobiales bacterium]